MDFSNFFSNFNTIDSYAILFMLLIAFLFGLLVGYLLRGGAVRRLKRELEENKKQIAEAQTEVAHLKEELNLRDADLRKAQFEVEENKTKVTRLADEKTKLYNEVYALNTELENLKKSGGGADPSEVLELNQTIERLNAQITALQSRNKQLENELNELKSAPLEERETVIDYLAEFQSTQNAMRGRLEALEQKLGKVESENSMLKNELQELKEGTGERGMVAGATTETSSEMNDEPILEFGTNKAILMDPVLHRATEQDDLTKINSITPEIEKKLNAAGVYNFEQISHWEPSDLHRITQEIAFMPGRIESENWIGQAINLNQKKKNNPESFESRGLSYPTENDDLKIVEGIGPKIEGLLKDAGISTWEELAEAEADQLREILHNAGESYRIHDPTTWPAQARLAANGSWELLREYQEQLKGGREMH